MPKAVSYQRAYQAYRLPFKWPFCHRLPGCFESGVFWSGEPLLLLLVAADVVGQRVGLPEDCGAHESLQ